jgi:F0F1-type ATP synthase assembly protein I
VPPNRSKDASRGELAWTTSALLLGRPGSVVAVTADDRESPSSAELLGLAGTLAVFVLVPLLIGLVVDSNAHTSPLGLLIGVVVGVAAAAAGLWVRLKRFL